MFRSLMIDQYGKQMSAQGGIGLASTITAQLLKHQEVAASDQQTQATTAETDATKAKTVQSTAPQGTAP
jgi:Rod binding domain-containing protein